jgi:hypothetical protein
LYKICIIVLIIMSICFLGLSIHYYINNTQLQKYLSQVSSKAKEDFETRIMKEKELIRKDLDEKYRADMVSYEATVKRLELEKKKVKDLQEQLKTSPVKELSK